MRALLCIVMALFLYSPAALAQTDPASAAIEVPTEFKGFFDDYSALMKKYPAAASRFGMFDQKNPSNPKAAGNTPLIRSSLCSGGGSCCTKWIDEGRPRCVQCSICLP